MSAVDCNAEEINTVNESASMVPDPYLQRTDQPRSKPAIWDISTSGWRHQPEVADLCSADDVAELDLLPLNRACEAATMPSRR
jgi:hypothetical protein